MLMCHSMQGNPLAAETFESLVNMAEYSCAVCLCDRLWVDPDNDSSNGVDFMEEKDMLRLDSMLLLVQLHIRYALKAQARLRSYTVLRGMTCGCDLRGVKHRHLCLNDPIPRAGPSLFGFDTSRSYTNCDMRCRACRTSTSFARSSRSPASLASRTASGCLLASPST